jgi:MHS family proline/betaine transporter-like MFS transporter
MQGLFLGGEGVGAAIYVLEHGMESESRMNRGVVGGMLISANMSGTLIASLVGLLINNTVGLDIITWRLAFVIGGIAGFAISFTRLSLPETEEFKSIDLDTKKKAPLLQLGAHWKESLIVLLFAGFTASMSQINKGYLSAHFQETMHFSANKSFLYVLYVSVLLAILPPAFGYFSNKYTYTKFNKLIITLVGILYLPAFILITKSDVMQVIAGLTIIAILTAAILTPTYVFVSDLFPKEVRVSGAALSFNVGVTLFGGFAPMIARYLAKKTGLNYAPAFYVLTLAMVYVVLLSLYTHLKKMAARQAEITDIRNV